MHKTITEHLLPLLPSLFFPSLLNLRIYYVLWLLVIHNASPKYISRFNNDLNAYFWGSIFLYAGYSFSGKGIERGTCSSWLSLTLVLDYGELF